MESEINIENQKCKICDKNFSSYKSLWNHNKNFHKQSIFNEQNDKILKYKCKFCNNYYKHLQSRWKHEKTCKYNNKIQLLEEKNKQLEEMINKLALEVKNKNLNQTNNGTINNNEIGTINNIQIVSLGREDLSKLSQKEQKNILKFGSSSLKKIITAINFNPKIPEQQNIKLTNLAKKTCKQYDEHSKNFIEVPKDRLICSLINIRTGDLIEIHEEFKEDGNRCHDSVNYIINVVNNYQDDSDNKDFEKKYIELKKEIELLIYNKTKELNNRK